MRAKNKMIIGIDPDIHLSGYALIDMRNLVDKFYTHELKVFSFFKLCDVILAIRDLCTLEDIEFVVVVEKGELNDSYYWAAKRFKQFKGGTEMSKVRRAIKTGGDIGKNFQVASLFIEFCEHEKIKCIPYKPTSKKWSRDDIKNLFGITKRSNPETRDALRAAVTQL